MHSHLHRSQIISTLVILVLAAISSLLGVFRPGHYQAAPELVESYQVQDITILVVGIPVVAAGLRYAVRNSPRGRIVWLGGLAYMTYMWFSISIQIPFNELFLVYIVLAGLSLFTFVSGLVTTDVNTIHQALGGRINPSLYSGALAVIGVGLATLWLSDIVPPLLSGTTPPLIEEAGPQAMASHVIDLGIVVPSIIVAAAWLYQERPWGYVFAGVVLVLGATLAAPIGVMTLVLMAGETVSISPIAALFTFLPIVVSALLAVTYLYSMEGQTHLPPDGDGRQSA
ncbi:hypothetical protein [Halapricum hydrolyticum]|uniref:Uncharacterized protein n=1 Tax=Halapricum hydrolyticum TaxID=2979991 RepID=A0AAE3IDJ9_9EURY|nr:hypothetical protein [Halapricum hydrolyticum]MCU4717455.1 hypothetical protein [Halapricum hydrolyticum]MCU4726619.1 hypothetical protein [Halapricum hydrolyticum]